MVPVPVVTLTIDDRPVGARGDQTVLEVARENGIRIPTLCHLEGLQPTAACRLCLVELDGSRRPVPACVTLVTEGMVVRTRSDNLDRYRRTIIELLLSERNHVCAVCVSNGTCELQSLAAELGIDRVNLPYLHNRHEVDASHERFVVDHNRCVLCTRCVRACHEIEGAHTWDVMGRGVDARVITDMNTPWGESDTCTTCGKCVRVCPTGALVTKGLCIGDVAKEASFLPYLTMMRRTR